GPTPDLESTGEVPFSEKNEEEAQKRKASTDILNRNIDEILSLMGNANLKTALQDPKVSGRIKERVLAASTELRNEMAARGFPDSLVKFIGQEVGDPTKWTAGNVTGLTNNRARLEELKRIVNEKRDIADRASGYRRKGGAQKNPKSINVK